MTSPVSRKPPVVASLERNKSVYHDQQLGQTEEHNCWNLRIDWLVLVLSTLLIIMAAVQFPELLPRVWTFAERNFSKH
jgi:hypothetical protein